MINLSIHDFIDSELLEDIDHFLLSEHSACMPSAVPGLIE